MSLSNEQKQNDVAELLNMLKSLASDETPTAEGTGDTGSTDDDIIIEDDESEESSGVPGGTTGTSNSKQQDIADLMEALKLVSDNDDDEEIDFGEKEGVRKDSKVTDFEKEVMNQSVREIPTLESFVTPLKFQEFYDKLLREYAADAGARQLVHESINHYFDKFCRKVLISNKFDYSYRNRDYKSKGLLLALSYLGTLVVIKDYNQNTYNEIRGLWAEQLVNSQQTGDYEKAVRCSVALGITADMANYHLELNEMPSKGRMNDYLEEAKSSIEYKDAVEKSNYSFDIDSGKEMGLDDENDSDRYFDEDARNIDTTGSEYNEYYSPDEDIYTGQQVFTMDVVGNVQLKPRPTQNVISVNPNDYVEATSPKYETVERFKKKLFESKNGTAYEFKKRWEFVLKAIKKEFRDTATISRIAFAGSQITVNGKIIRFNGILGGDYDVQLEDILDIRKTLKAFPFVKQLILDSNATQVMIKQYGPDAHGVWAVFQSCRSLDMIGLIPAGSSQAVNYYRQSFASTADTLNKQLGIENHKMQVELAMAQKNPRLSNKRPGYLHNVWGNAKAMGFNSFAAGQKAMMAKDPKLARALKYSVIGAGLIGFGGVLALGGRAATGVRDLVGIAREFNR